MWCCRYFLVGVLVFTYVLGQIVSITLEVGRFRRLQRFFEKGFTPEMLERMDFVSDGQVRVPPAMTHKKTKKQNNYLHSQLQFEVFFHSFLIL